MCCAALAMLLRCAVVMHPRLVSGRSRVCEKVGDMKFQAGERERRRKKDAAITKMCLKMSEEFVLKALKEEILRELSIDRDDCELPAHLFERGMMREN